MPLEQRLQLLRGFRMPDSPQAGSGMLYPEGTNINLRQWLRLGVEKGYTPTFQPSTARHAQLVAVSMLHHYIDYLQNLTEKGRLVSSQDFPMYRLNEREGSDPNPEPQAIHRILDDARKLNRTDNSEPDFAQARERLVQFAEEKFYPWLNTRIPHSSKKVIPLSLTLTSKTEKELGKKLDSILKDPSSSAVMGRFNLLLEVKRNPEQPNKTLPDQETQKKRRRRKRPTTPFPVFEEYEEIDLREHAIKAINLLQKDLKLVEQS